MNQSNQIYCNHHRDQLIESICVKESCCNELKCPQCESDDCKIIKLSVLNDRFKQFKDDLNKITSQIDGYNQSILTILRQNRYEIVVQDIINTENAIFTLKEHINIINTRQIIETGQLQQPRLKYETNLQCRKAGHEQFMVTCVNLKSEDKQSLLLCNLCHRDFQFAKDFNNVKKICEDYLNVKEMKEIRVLLLQHYDQYLKRFKQLSNLVEDQTMYNYIKDKLTYFDHDKLDLKDMFDDKFMEFLRPKIDSIDNETRKKLFLIKSKLEKNNIEKLNINDMDKQILHKFKVDYKFRNDLNSEGTPYLGPKLTANLNYLKLVTIYDPMVQVKNSQATIRFIDEKDNTLEQFTVGIQGNINYCRQKLGKFEEYQIDRFSEDQKSHEYKINFYLFLGKEMQKYILLSYQGQMMLKQLQNWKELKYFQVAVKLTGDEAYGRIVTQQL